MSLLSNVWLDRDEVHSLMARLFRVAGPDMAKFRWLNPAEYVPSMRHSECPKCADGRSVSDE